MGRGSFKHEDLIPNTYCMTSDLDWASESQIETMLSLFFETELPLTPFVTHESKVVRRLYDNSELRGHVGLHFNFLKGTTQGKTEEQIIANTRAIWPQANFYRNHCFYDNSRLQETLRQLGFVFDSNTLHFMQPCSPILSWNGVVRLPVFWEDDVHVRQGRPLKVAYVDISLDYAGPKIFNLHPRFVSANLNFTKTLLKHISSVQHCKTAYLDDLYRTVSGKAVIIEAEETCE